MGSSTDGQPPRPTFVPCPDENLITSLLELEDGASWDLDQRSPADRSEVTGLRRDLLLQDGDLGQFDIESVPAGAGVDEQLPA